MSRVLLFLLVALSILGADSIKWKNSIKEALYVAKKDNKIVMIFVEAKHCPWCEKMLTTTLSDKDVVRNLNRDYICAKIDADSKEGKEYFPSLAITPTIYFVTGNKEYLDSLEGFNSDEFLYWSMSKAERKFKEIRGK